MRQPAVGGFTVSAISERQRSRDSGLKALAPAFCTIPVGVCLYGGYEVGRPFHPRFIRLYPKINHVILRSRPRPIRISGFLDKKMRMHPTLPAILGFHDDQSDEHRRISVITGAEAVWSERMVWDLDASSLACSFAAVSHPHHSSYPSVKTTSVFPENQTGAV